MTAPADPQTLPAEFDRCAAWLEPSVTLIPGAYRIEDVRAACLEGRMQLWPGERAAMVTEVLAFPRRVGCHVGFMGGDPMELEKLGATVVAWAKAHGGDYVSCMGRPQWIRSADTAESLSTYTVRNL
jgi:hypothetical protein